MLNAACYLWLFRNTHDMKSVTFTFKSFTWLKPTKMIAEKETNCWIDCEKCYSSIKLLKDTFEWMNSNETENSKRWNIKQQKHQNLCYILCFSAKIPILSSPFGLLPVQVSSSCSGLPYRTSLLIQHWNIANKPASLPALSALPG